MPLTRCGKVLTESLTLMSRVSVLVCHPDVCSLYTSDHTILMSYLSPSRSPHLIILLWCLIQNITTKTCTTSTHLQRPSYILSDLFEMEIYILNGPNFAGNVRERVIPPPGRVLQSCDTVNPQHPNSVVGEILGNVSTLTSHIQPPTDTQFLITPPGRWAFLPIKICSNSDRYCVYSLTYLHNIKTPYLLLYAL